MRAIYRYLSKITRNIRTKISPLSHALQEFLNRTPELLSGQSTGRITFPISNNWWRSDDR